MRGRSPSGSSTAITSNLGRSRAGSACSGKSPAAARDPALAGIHTARRTAVCLGRARAHLDQCEFLAATRDDIEFTATATVIPQHDLRAAGAGKRWCRTSLVRQRLDLPVLELRPDQRAVDASIWAQPQLAGQTVDR